MKLTKNTRNQVKIGTHLKDSISEYVVTNMWPAGRNGMVVSLKCIADNIPNNKWLIGRTIYGEPLSKCYGMEIVEEEEI